MEDHKVLAKGIPSFYDVLNTIDQKGYNNLQSLFLTKEYHHVRNQSETVFILILEETRAFCIHNDSEDQKRCLVCGICWVQSGIGINLDNFGILTHRCKSSINGSLKQRRYVSESMNSPYFDEILRFIPLLQHNLIEKRKWSARHISPTEPSGNSISDENLITTSHTPHPFPVPILLFVDQPNTPEPQHLPIPEQPPLTIPPFPVDCDVDLKQIFENVFPTSSDELSWQSDPLFDDESGYYNHFAP
jgi:hypothetical protein